MIIYFSGTGNSRYVAEYIAAVVGDETVSLNELMREGPKAEFSSRKPYVFVVPTYAWRMPRVVEQFIQNSRFSGHRSAYFVLTCGGGVGNAAAYAKRLCEEKYLTFMGLKGIVMPENYIAMFKVPGKEEAEKIIAAATPEIESTARIIKERTALPEEKVSIGGKLSSRITPLFYSLCVSPVGFRVTADKCTACGNCERVCPLDNIKVIAEKPVWREQCTHCMACISSCPTEAIEYNKKTANKNRYYLTKHPDIAE